MLNTLKQSLWQQFGASIDTLKAAIELCPETMWNTERKFWYQAFHTLFFLDYYLTQDPVHFAPPPPFTLSEFEDTLPERVYSKEELLVYLTWCRNKCEQLIHSMTNEMAESQWINESKTMNYPVIEILMYNMRHVQHHAAQLNLLLRQEINNAPGWVFRANEG
jgi:hypothetical protein